VEQTVSGLKQGVLSLKQIISGVKHSGIVLKTLSLGDRNAKTGFTPNVH
jgi:hypothetical protein